MNALLLEVESGIAPFHKGQFFIKWKVVNGFICFIKYNNFPI